MKSKLWMLFLLVGILSLSGCKSKKDDNVKVGNQIPAAVTADEETKEEKKSKDQDTEDTQKNDAKEKEETLYVLLKMDAGKQEVRLQNVESGRISEYGFSDATSYRDKYGNFTTASSMTQGKIVNIGAANADGNLSYIQLADHAWEQDDVEKFEIDTERNMMIIGKTKYYYDDSLLVFLDDEQITLDMITESDRLRVAGVDKKVASVFVTSGHGYLALTHTDLFEGGFLSVGKECVVQVVKDMKVEVPEGTYQVSVANDGYGDTKEVTVTKNETTVLNLEEYKGEGPKMGKVQFHITPENSTITIDGKQIDPAQPVELRYGTYKLAVSSEEYGQFQEKLVISSTEAEVSINLKQLSEAEKEEEEKKKETSSSSGTSSSGSGSSAAASGSGSNNTSGSSSSSKKSSTNSSSSSKSSNSKNTSNSTAEDSDGSDLKKISDFISTLLD